MTNGIEGEKPNFSLLTEPNPTPYIPEPARDDPRRVVMETGQIMDAYLLEYGAIVDSGKMQRYLANDTLGFINDAAQGRILTVGTGSRDDKGIAHIASQGRENLIFSQNAVQAFNIASIIFSLMPTMTDEIPGHLLRHRLEPPESPHAFLLRLREMQKEVVGIAAGITPPATDVRSRDSLLRTFSFFRTGQQLAA